MGKKSTPSLSDVNQETAKTLQEIIAMQVQIRQEVARIVQMKVANEIILKYIQGERQALK